MKLSPQWIREFVDLTVDDRRLAEDLTNVGISVESISGAGTDTVFEMEIGTNRPDAMNHYGVAREAAAIYELPLKAAVGHRRQIPTSRKGREKWGTRGIARHTISNNRRGACALSAIFGAGDSRHDDQGFS